LFYMALWLAVAAIRLHSGYTKTLTGPAFNGVFNMYFSLNIVYTSIKYSRTIVHITKYPLLSLTETT